MDKCQDRNLLFIFTLSLPIPFFETDNIVFLEIGSGLNLDDIQLISQVTVLRTYRFSGTSAGRS